MPPVHGGSHANQPGGGIELSIVVPVFRSLFSAAGIACGVGVLVLVRLLRSPGSRPAMQGNAEGLRQVSRWLELPENRDQKFCLVASSVATNQGNFRELWQLLPEVGRNAYDARMVRLG